MNAVAGQVNFLCTIINHNKNNHESSDVRYGAADGSGL